MRTYWREREHAGYWWVRSWWGSPLSFTRSRLHCIWRWVMHRARALQNQTIRMITMVSLTLPCTRCAILDTGICNFVAPAHVYLRSNYWSYEILSNGTFLCRNFRSPLLLRKLWRLYLARLKQGTCINGILTWGIPGWRGLNNTGRPICPVPCPVPLRKCCIGPGPVCPPAW